MCLLTRNIPGKNLSPETTTVTHGVPAGANQVGRDLGPIMTPTSQTSRGADELRQPSFASPNRLVNITFWNVRTMFQTSKAAQVAKEFREYRLDILGISECRWPGTGRLMLTSGETVIWSGKEREHEGGVALMMDRKTEKCLLEWKGISDRILKARFDSKYVKTTVFVCYAPTNSASEDEKERFYEQLQGAVSEVDNHDILIVGGE